ncbi:MAG: DUF4097 domain-containing protein [Halobacteriales archaeon]|nr:DUF4097 domain-containing protein [Halobacteriales archaeon]
MSSKRFLLALLVLVGLFVGGAALAAVVVPHVLFGEGLTKHSGGAGPGQDFAGTVAIGMCVGTGTVALAPSPDGRAHVEVHVRGMGSSEQEARAAAQSLQPEVRTGTASLLVHEPARSWRWGEPHATMSARILLPGGVLAKADLNAGTGSVDVQGVRLARLDATAGTGDIDVRPAWAQGRIDVSAGTGSIRAAFAGLGSADLDLSAGTGDIDVRLPGDAQHGYRLDASTGTGVVSLDLPDITVHGDQHRRSATTNGFDQRATRVTGDLSAGRGNVRVTSA